MNRYYSAILFFLLITNTSQITKAQSIIPFGDVKVADLENKLYKPDPGADAIILSDIGVVTLNYNNGFYVQLERDVKVRIVNSNGFDYANIEVPLSSDDKLYNYQASTFNLVNGQKVESKIDKKSFIIENATRYHKLLKFNFPDVHEGSVIEYSYTVRLSGGSLSILVPWEFQSDIPVVKGSLTIVYPEYFEYKSIISGSAELVTRSGSTSRSFFLGRDVRVNNELWYVNNLPAFKEEPVIKSKKEHLIKIDFELASVTLPNSTFEEITPTYETLTQKLLDRSDFGIALRKTSFLKKDALEVTAGIKDELLKLNKIHQFISSKMLWNGVKDYTASSTLREVYNKEKGNSADINLILIGMLRAVNIKAEPVILSTRSNGSLNKQSAMIQQFNYVVAYVYINDQYYFIDATDPLRPFDLLPFECLNYTGRLISTQDSKFVDIKNKEKYFLSSSIRLTMDSNGNLNGTLKKIFSDYNAYEIRNYIKNEGEEGYLDLIKSNASDGEISDFKLSNITDRDSNLILTCGISFTRGAQVAGDKILFNPFLSFEALKNPFFSDKRKFPVDFGCPRESSYSLTITIPSGYSLAEIPENVTLSLGNGSGSYDFSCIQDGDRLIINSSFKVVKTLFVPAEYTVIQDFYSKVLQKQAELIVFTRNIEKPRI